MNDKTSGAAHPAPDAELRLATLVKCDIVDSTRIWSGLDPSDGLELARAFRRTVDQVVERHGGYVVRWEGDCVLICFGYPEAMEDAPEVGVRTGLDLVQDIRSVRSAGTSLELRVGVASGHIAVDLTSDALEGMVFNAAERLKTMADPGQVVIDTKTRSLAGNFFDYVDLGARPAKGFEGGLQAWGVVGETEVVSRYEAQRFDHSPAEIIGRVEELATLAKAWANARKGAGQVVVLAGDAGMGKSRLARTVLDWAAHDNAARIEIDCTPSTSNSPLFPVGVWFRRAAGISDPMASDSRKSELASAFLARFLAADEVPDALASLAPVFGLPAAAGSDEPTRAAMREKTIATIVKVLLASAAHGPLVVLCEDLHWADDTTATVIQRLAEQTSGQPAMLIATERSKSEISIEAKLVGDAYSEIALAPLPEPDAADLIRSIAKGAALASALVRDIVRRCEGVPLILEEVTRGTLETTPHGNPAAGGADGSGSVPAPLQLVVESRLERWRQYKNFVQAASVLGREFSLDLLERLVPDHAGEAAQVVRLLAENGLFTPQGGRAGDRGRFTHAMIRDAVYQTLLRNDRRALHSRVADMLRSGDRANADASPDQLAQHLAEAARHEEAIQVRLDASADTVARGNYVETVGHCEAALQFIHEVKDPARRSELQFRLLEQLAVALTGQHGYSSKQAEAVYRRACEAFTETTPARTRYPFMRGLTASTLVRGKLAEGYDLSLAALELAERSGLPAFRIDAMSVHCYAALYFRSLQECRSWIMRCLALYREEGGEKLKYPVPNDAATAALAILPTVEWLLGDAAAAEAAVQEGLRHVDRHDADFDKAYMHAWIAGLRFTQRRYPESREAARRAFEIAMPRGFSEWYTTGYLIERLAQAAMEPSPAALGEAKAACMTLASVDVGLNASWYAWGIARGHLVAQEPAEAAGLIQYAFFRATTSEETRMLAELRIFEAELAPDNATAAGLLQQALDTADAQGSVADALRAAAALVTRSEAEPAAVDLARATLDLLEGRGDYPAQAGWMAQRLETLRQALTATERVAVRA